MQDRDYDRDWRNRSEADRNYDTNYQRDRSTSDYERNRGGQGFQGDYTGNRGGQGFQSDYAANRGFNDQGDRRDWQGRSGDYGDNRSYGRGMTGQQYGQGWQGQGQQWQGRSQDWRAQDWQGEDRFSGQDYGRNTGFGRGYESGRGYGDQRFGGQQYGSGTPSMMVTEYWLIAGPYTGRGPRGYQRSDERIREDVNERLTHHGQIDATEIIVTVLDGEVTLSGTVDDRQQKRAAGEVAEDVSGVRDVHNQIKVNNNQNQSLGDKIKNVFTGNDTSNTSNTSGMTTSGTTGTTAGTTTGTTTGANTTTGTTTGTGTDTLAGTSSRQRNVQQ